LKLGATSAVYARLGDRGGGATIAMILTYVMTATREV